MPATAPAVTVTATKMASGTVQWVLTVNNATRVAFVMPAADVTNVNTNVNGGAGGATRSFTYAQDLNLGDYPFGYVSGM